MVASSPPALTAIAGIPLLVAVVAALTVPEEIAIFAPTLAPSLIPEITKSGSSPSKIKSNPAIVVTTGLPSTNHLFSSNSTTSVGWKRESTLINVPFPLC